MIAHIDNACCVTPSNPSPPPLCAAAHPTPPRPSRPPQVPGAKQLLPRLVEFEADMELLNNVLYSLIERTVSTRNEADLEALQNKDYTNVRAARRCVPRRGAMRARPCCACPCTYFP